MTKRELYPAGEPDYSIPPGETIRELLEEQGVTVEELVARGPFGEVFLRRLLVGEEELTEDVAVRLEQALGTPVRLWLLLEANYRSRHRR